MQLVWCLNLMMFKIAILTCNACHLITVNDGLDQFIHSLPVSSWDVAMQDVLHRYGALESPQHHIQVERVSHYPSWSEQDLSLGLKPWTRSFAQHQLQCWYVFYIGHYLLMRWILRASMSCTFGALCCLHSCSIRMSGWRCHTQETLAALYFIGSPITYLHSLIH